MFQRLKERFAKFLPVSIGSAIVGAVLLAPLAAGAVGTSAGILGFDPVNRQQVQVFSAGDVGTIVASNLAATTLKSNLTFGAVAGTGANLIASGTNATGVFFGPQSGGGATEANYKAVVSTASTFTNLYVQVPTSTGLAGTTIAVTLRVNGASSTLTCTVNGGTTCNDTTHTVTTVAGDNIDLLVTTGGTAAQAAFYATVEQRI